MAQTNERSLSEIQRETQQARSTLVETVQELRNSVSEGVKPATIKAEMTGYLRSRAGDLLDDATRAARENPLHTAAVVGTIAYPALRLARAIPLPLWLVGAGLFLAKSETVAQGAATLQEKMSDLGSKAASGLQDTLGSASERLNEVGERAGSAAASGSDKIGDLAASAGAALRETTEKITDVAARIPGAVGEAAGKISSFGKDAAHSAQSSAYTARDGASDFGSRATGTFFRALEDNPLTVAGVGLFIGGLIAGALPRSELEQELVGETSRLAKRRAQAAVDQGIGAVSDAAREGIRHAVRQAEAEGLAAEGVSEAARDIGQRVRKVAEAAVTAAFEPPEQNEQSGVDGGRENG
jgi:hypothetical protein